MSCIAMLRSAPRCVTLILLSCVSIAPLVAAQDAGSGLRACVSQSDDKLRLECYDHEMRRSAPASGATAAVAPAPSQAAAQQPAVIAAPSMTAEEAFGFKGAVAREEIDRRNSQLKSVDLIESTIAEVDKRPFGEYVVTLANGQVWAQKSPEPSTRLKVGDQVMIKRASLGSFLMSVPGTRTTQVARVK